MSIPVISEFVPCNSGYFPLLDARYIRGGFQSVATSGDRDNIPSGIRSTGLTVYVQENRATYQLASGVTNNDWSRVYDNGIALTFNSTTGLVINHNLGFFPNVQLIDGSGHMLIGKIEHQSVNQALVRFNQSTAGTAYCS